MATLTGESLPIRKQAARCPRALPADPEQTVFAGTTVISGNGAAVVYATGAKTEFGRIASLATEVHKRPTPMQLEIIRITRILTLAALIVGGIFFVLGFLSGRGFFVAAIFALSLIVANVPEGMLPTITLSLSVASQNMARRNALIKNLDSVQTLGSVTVICTDKTGTLTRNQMSAKVICLAGGEEIHITGEGYFSKREFAISNEGEDSRQRLEWLLLAGVLNCRAKVTADDTSGDPTEIAIVAAARQAGIETEGYEKVSEIPFTSDRKMMSTLVKKGGETFIFTKGAPEVIVPIATTYLDKNSTPVPLDPATRDKVAKKAELMGREAYRVLAVAYRKGTEENDLVLLGLIGFLDLPRAEVADAVKTCYTAKIRVMVLTGDNPVTAAAVAKRIGLRVDRTFTGDELLTVPDDELARLLKTEDILFARMHPDQKLRIAKILQENGEIVAMTGDGVNDAPALKKADIGIAMGERGTEVAKEAADMILIDDNFASIVAAVEEGRTIYFNIKKFVTYILSSNVPEIVPYILQFFLKIPLPLSVIQILSIDLGSDMLPGLALGSERPEKGIMERPPVGKNEKILDREVFKRGYFFIGVIEAAAAMTAFLGFLFLNGWVYGDMSIAGTPLHYQAMTMTLLGAITCQLANVWTLRSWELSAFRPGLFGNRLLLLAIAVECIWIWMLLNVGFVQVIFDTAFIPPHYLLLLVPFPIILFTAHEVYKYLHRTRAALQPSVS
jgi:sodium/potassium-transporting ATPase subunit alpha